MKDFSFGIVPVVQTDAGIEILLVQHQSKVGHWAFPKWHAEWQEIPLETAKREFEEETGILASFLTVEEDKIFDTHYRFKLFPKNILIEKTVTYFLAYLPKKLSVSVQKSELRDFSWLPFDAALDKLTYSIDKEMLNHFVKYF